MSDYLITLYTIHTQLSWIKAETLDEAKQLIADHDESIRWMEIPQTRFISWSKDGKVIGPSFTQVLGAYIEEQQ